MLNVALTGNIAAGKSAVAELFRAWGATLIDADRLAREAQAPGTPGLRAIAERLGPDLVGADGALDRAALRRRVMADPAALAELNRIIHPEVFRRRRALEAEARRRGDRIVVSDIPLLFEVADPAAFDVVVLVDAPEPVRRSRLIMERGLSALEADRMLAAQAPSGPKRERSTFVIDNDGDLATLEARAREVWTALLARA
ncbi:MAG TPA: dephospho-CoA kinase [Gemmatimonadales bacterium]|jgi:dephospho-CoA kinase|nr:dephospho-CoA kinase [Gemmatimonadales bacterium]